MKFFAKEMLPAKLYDEAIKPYPLVGVDWVGLIKSGDCELEEHFPILPYDEFIDYVLNKRYIMTMTPLDDLFRDFPPRVNAELATYGETREGLRIRPVSRRGVSKIGVHFGNHHGYVFDASQYVDSMDLLVPLIESLDRLGCKLDTFTTIAGIARSLLLSKAPRAYSGVHQPGAKNVTVISTIDPIHLIRAAATFRLGRNEAFRVGTEQYSTMLDIVSAYPSEFMTLQTAHPSFTYWTDSTVYDPNACYGFYEVEELIPSGEDISLVSHKATLPGGARLFYPNGGRRSGFMGKAMLELCLGLGYRLGTDIMIIGASQAYAKYDCHPFELAMTGLFKAQQDPRFSSFYKSIGHRIVGCNAATYLKSFPPWGRSPGEVSRLALPTYNPIYAAAVVDRVLARICTLALKFPKERLIGFSIDGLQILGGADNYPTVGKPGDIIRKFTGQTSRFTDLLGDKDGGTKWAERLEGDKLIIPHVRRTLVGTFRLHNLKDEEGLIKSAAEFKEATTIEYRVNIGSSKRWNLLEGGLDYTKESYPTGDVVIDDIPELCCKEGDGDVILEEEGDDKL